MDQVVIIGTPDYGSDSFFYQYPGASFSGGGNAASHGSLNVYMHSVFDQLDPSDIGGGKQFFPTTEARTVYIDSTPTVQVSYDNIRVHNLVTQSLVNAFNEITASVPGLTNINISATTNGHLSNSNHGVGDALDMNFANGVHIGTSGTGLQWAVTLENAAMANGNVRFVEGPMGNFARDTPNSPWVRTPDLGPTQLTHVHFDVFPKKK